MFGVLWKWVKAWPDYRHIYIRQELAQLKEARLRWPVTVVWLALERNCLTFSPKTSSVRRTDIESQSNVRASRRSIFRFLITCSVPLAHMHGVWKRDSRQTSIGPFREHYHRAESIFRLFSIGNLGACSWVQLLQPFAKLTFNLDDLLVWAKFCISNVKRTHASQRNQAI